MVQNLCYHSHNFFCDGSSHPEEYIKEAVNQKVIDYGFSSHSPLKFLNNWSIELEKLDYLFEIVKILQEKYKNKINIYKSIEADYAPYYSMTFDYFRRNYDLDYLIGSVHLVKNHQNSKLLFIDGPAEKFKENLKRIYNNNLKKAFEDYVFQNIEMINKEKPDILGHMDRILVNASKAGFETNSAWYKSLIDNYIKEIKESNIIVEVNTRAKYKGKYHDTNPGKYILSKLYKNDIPLIVSTDTHKPSEISLLYFETISELKEIGFKTLMRFDGAFWKNSEVI